MKLSNKVVCGLACLGFMVCAHAMQEGHDQSAHLDALEREVKSLREFCATMSFIQAFEEGRYLVALVALQNGANKAEAIRFIRKQLKDDHG